MNGYSISNLGLDYSALMNPYAMYNPYLNYGITNGANPSFKGASQSAQTTTQTTTNIASKGAATTNKSSKHTAKLILGSAITIGAAALCRKAYVKGGGQGLFSKDFLSKTKNGFVEMFNELKGKFPRLTERFTVDANKNTCQIPGQINKLQGANMADDIVRLGGSADIPKLADEGVEILEATYQINSRSAVTFRNGQVVSFKNSKGKVVPINEMTANEQEKVAKILKRIENKDVDTLDKLTRVSYSKTQNEVTSYFAKGFDQAEDGITDGLQYGLTKNFHLDSDDARVYLKEHEQVRKAFEEFRAGNAKDLRYAYAEYPVAGVGTLRIQNGKVTGIEMVENGVKKFYDTDSVKFKAQDLEETVEKIFEHTADFVNPRYIF